MDGLLAILKAAHCRSTHHHFAIDALRHIRTDAGTQLLRMLLRYHDAYLAGAKDPDTRFRDFQNHVVHVADSNWGGAPRAAERWYGRVQAFLRREEWMDAAHAIGVLSHYFTDPLQPLHTGQSPREAVVHRPLEWSICKSYESIRSRWRDDRFRIVYRLSNRSDWLASAVLRGAEVAHRSYETLVNTYDLEAARTDPRRGLNEASIEALAELFGVAIVGWARVLERTAEEAEGHLPQVGLLGRTIVAALRIPQGLLLRRIESKQELQAAKALLEYYHRAGDLGPHVPEEVRLVRKVLAVRDYEREYLESLKKQTEVTYQATIEPPTTLRVIFPDQVEETPTIPAAPLAGSLAKVEMSSESAVELGETHSPGQHRRITLACPIVDAPSIGPRTAERFNEIGILNIGQFLGANPEELTRKLRVRWIGVEQIADWQDQTRLMMDLSGLRVRDAQLLVGAGCRSLSSLAVSRLEDLMPQINKYASSPAGRRSLRGATSPKPEEVKRWIELASKQIQSDRVRAA